MSRKKGTAVFAVNFEPSGQMPLDARLLVADMNELIATETYASNNYYIGMPVIVIKGKSGKTELWVLKDTTKINLEEGWQRLDADEAAINKSIKDAIENLNATVGGTTIDTGKHVAVQVVQENGKLKTLTVTENDIASKTSLDNEVTRATGAETTLSGRIDALVSGDNSVDKQIEALKTELVGGADTLNTFGKVENAIGVINGEGEGSIKKAASDAVAKVVAGADADFDTLKEVADWIKSDKTGAAKMQADIAKLQGGKDEVGSVAHSIDNAVNALDATVGGTTIAEGKHVAVQVAQTDGKLTGLTVNEKDIASKTSLDNEVTRATGAEKGINDIIGTGFNATNTVAKAIEKALADAKADSASKIETLDVIDTKVSKKFVTQVSETDGKIAVERGEITSTDKTVVINDGADGGIDLSVNVDGTTILKNVNTGKLSVAPTALIQYTGKDAVAVGAGVDGEKEISLNIDTTDKILSQSADGLLTTLSMTYNSNDKTIKLTGKDNTEISTIDATDFVVDGMLDSVEFSTESGKENILVFTWNTDSGKTKTEIDLSKYIDTYNAGNGINLINKVFSVKVKDGDKYLEVTSNGIASKGIDTAITTAINTLNVTEQSENGKYVSAISQTNGKINPTLKQVEANEVKLEQIGEVDANGIKLNATTVQEGIAELFTKILDNEEVDAEAINKVKTILGITGEELKYEAKSDDTIIGAATSYSDADIKLAEAIRTAQDNAITIQSGNGVNIASNGSAKTINVKVVNDDKLITVDNSGIHTKDNAVFDCGKY